MKRRLAIVAVFILVALAVPSAFACKDCPDGSECIIMTAEGFQSCFETPSGCVVSGNCGLAATAALAPQWKVAAVRVIEPARPLPLPTALPKAAVVLTAAK
jgi:hypothetical protein